MKKYLLLPFLLVICGISSFAQHKGQEEVLMTIGNENVTKPEFLRVYQKYSTGEALPFDQKSIEDYLSLYTIFKLKVKDALDKKIDTLPAIKNELAGYREQLAAPYLTDEATMKRLVKEAYEESKYDIRLSHIIFNIDPKGNVSDTLEAYKKAQEAHNRLKKGENFEKVASEMSDDYTQKNSSQAFFIGETREDLGYRTPFSIPYELEKAAYQMKVGEFSKPIRTNLGYQIILLTDKQPVLGQITCAHILFFAQEDASDSIKESAYENIQAIYKDITSGKITFEEAARTLSEDKFSAKKDGLLDVFTVTRMYPEFIKNLYPLRSGDISKPFQTRFGWHIVKLINKTGIQTFENSETELENKIKKDIVRNKIVINAFIDSVKHYYHFKEIPHPVNTFMPTVDESLLYGQWKYVSGTQASHPLFFIGKDTLTFDHFATYLQKTQIERKDATNTLAGYLQEYYTTFVNNYCYQYANKNLENRYPNFQELMQEYHDGVLLFEATNQEVWQRSVKDTAGLNAFFATIIPCYQWDVRAQASSFSFDPNKVKLTTMEALLKKAAKKQWDKTKLISEVKKKFKKGEVFTSTDYYEKNTDTMIDQTEWTVGNFKTFNISPTEITMVYIYKVLPPTCKTLEETKGLVISEYQNYLEAAWVRSLKSKYHVTVNENVLNSIIKK